MRSCWAHLSAPTGHNPESPWNPVRVMDSDSPPLALGVQQAVSGPGQLAHRQSTWPKPWGDKHAWGPGDLCAPPYVQGASSLLLGNSPPTFTPTPNASHCQCHGLECTSRALWCSGLGHSSARPFSAPVPPGAAAFGIWGSRAGKVGEAGEKEGPSTWAAWALGAMKGRYG